jgi:hypothetical protein
MWISADFFGRTGQEDGGAIPGCGRNGSLYCTTREEWVFAAGTGLLLWFQVREKGKA